jgi:hypothetical protein
MKPGSEQAARAAERALMREADRHWEPKRWPCQHCESRAPVEYGFLCAECLASETPERPLCESLNHQ